MQAGLRLMIKAIGGRPSVLHKKHLPVVKVNCFSQLRNREFDELPFEEKRIILEILNSSKEHPDPTSEGKENADAALQVMQTIRITSVPRDDLFKIIVFFCKSNLRKFNFMELMLMVAKLLDRFLLGTPQTNISAADFSKIFILFISTSNLNLKSPKCFEIIFDQANEKYLIDFFNCKDNMIYIPNTLYSMVKLNYSISDYHRQVIERLLAMQLENAHSIFIQKKISLLTTIFLSDLKNRLSTELISQIINTFITNYDHRSLFQFNFNPKFALTFADFFCQLIPESCKYIAKYGYVPEDIAWETPYTISNMQILVTAMNKCLQIIKLNNRANIDFHPIYMENKGKALMLHKKVAYGNPNLYEKLVAEHLQKLGYSNVKASQMFGIYEVDLLIDNEIAVKLNGNKHYIWKMEEIQGNPSAPFVSKTNELILPQVYKENVLRNLGIQRIINIEVQPSRKITANDFAAGIASNIDSILKSHQP